MKASNPNNYAVICLAAGKSQIPVITKAKTLGYTVVAIDQNREAHGFKYADFKIYQSTYDADPIIKELEILKNKFKWIGILNRSSGPPVVTAAKICKHFNLPGVPIESARKLVNKDKMRTACRKQNIASLKYKIYDIDKCNIVDIEKLPIVIKPALSIIGKSGVSVVRSKNKIKSSIRYAIKNTINRKILIEEFIKGPDLSFISFVSNGQLFPICLLEEINIETKKGIMMPKGFKTHNSDNNNWMQKAHNIAKKIISKFNIKCSPLMISLRPDCKNNLKLIEVHLDMGGDHLIEVFYPIALPFDFVKFAVKIATGKAKALNDFNVKPTAIYYEGSITSGNHKILTANSAQMLEEKILKANV